jgi:hypothetical protein
MAAEGATVHHALGPDVSPDHRALGRRRLLAVGAIFLASAQKTVRRLGQKVTALRTIHPICRHRHLHGVVAQHAEEAAAVDEDVEDLGTTLALADHAPQLVDAIDHSRFMRLHTVAADLAKQVERNGC